MASKLVLSVCMVAIVTAIYWNGGAMAQTSCTNELMGLSPCLNYVTGNTSTPPSSCCTQLAGVVRTQPQCLCLLLNGGTSSVGITINQTRALELPDTCKVQTPPASRCNSANGPSSSPADTSNPNTSNTPSVTTDNTPADVGRGSKTVPSTVDSSAAGDPKTSIFKLLGFLLLIASYTLTTPAF